jgi:hypothetical protein
MSTLSVTSINTVNSTTDATHSTGNTSAGKMTLLSSGGLVIAGNSTVNSISISNAGAITISSNSTVNAISIDSNGNVILAGNSAYNAITISNTGTLSLATNATSNALYVAANGAVNYAGKVSFNSSASFAADVIPSTSFIRNRLINGNMGIDQRNNGSAYTITTSYQYTTDRWAAASASATNLSTTMTVTRVATATSGASYYCARINRSAASTFASYIYFGQVLETINSYDLAGKTLTFSFKARKGSGYAASNPSLVAVTGTATDQSSAAVTSGSWTGYAAPAVTTISQPNLTTSFQTYSFSFTPSSTAQQVAVLISTGNFTGTAGTNDYIEITDAQLEIGSSPTPYELRNYGWELAMCQRYYEYGRQPLKYQNNQSDYSSCSAAYDSGTFRVTKRTAPTVAASGFQYYSGGTGTAFTPIIAGLGVDGYYFTASGTSSWCGWTGNGTWYANAEI